MKKWRNSWKQVPRSVKLILNLVVIAFFLFVVLQYLDFPYFTASSAFRHSVDNRCETITTELEMDLISDGKVKLDVEEVKLVFGSNDTKVFIAEAIHEQDLRGWSVKSLFKFRPIEDGLWCVPLYWNAGRLLFLNAIDEELDYWSVSRSWGGDALNGKTLPCFAVKAPNLTSLEEVDMTLVLDPFEDERISLPGEQYPLKVKAAGNGWVVFSADAVELFERNAYNKSSLLGWMRAPSAYTGRVEFTVSNQTFTWELEEIRQTQVR